MSTIMSLPSYFLMLQQLLPYVCAAHFRVGCEGFFFPTFKAIISSSKLFTFSLNILWHSYSSRVFMGFGVLKNCLGFFFPHFTLTHSRCSNVPNAKLRISFWPTHVIFPSSIAFANSSSKKYKMLQGSYWINK